MLPFDPDRPTNVLSTSMWRAMAYAGGPCPVSIPRPSPPPNWASETLAAMKK